MLRRSLRFFPTPLTNLDPPFLFKTSLIQYMDKSAEKDLYKKSFSIGPKERTGGTHSIFIFQEFTESYTKPKDFNGYIRFCVAIFFSQFSVTVSANNCVFKQPSVGIRERFQKQPKFVSNFVCAKIIPYGIQWVILRNFVIHQMIVRQDHLRDHLIKVVITGIAHRYNEVTSCAGRSSGFKIFTYESCTKSSAN